MYPDYMKPSLRKVVETRGKRFELAKTGEPVYPLMDAGERKEVLQKFHPDFKKDARKKIRIGPDKGEALTTEVSEMLESHSRITPKMFDLKSPDYETDLLIIGGGGAGAAAAIVAMKDGVQVDHRHQTAYGGRQLHDVPGRHAGGGERDGLSDAPLTSTPWAEGTLRTRRSWCAPSPRTAPRW